MSNQDLDNLPFKDDLLASRYEVQQQLAKKAGRRTLLARDRSSGELAVVKLLSFASDFEWDSLKLFEREAETLKTLSHPAIPRYLDFFELNSANSKGFALVQTYIPALSLEEYLKAGRTFSEAEVRQLAKALLEILIYLHGRQPPLLHRDIKPSNILLGDRSHNIGQYRVDFGSVQTLAAREGGTMTVVGTYGYMPPEQFGDRTVPASDLYSLGATLIYLVTGIHPADLPHKDGRIQFEQNVNLSPAFAHWLKWMTEPSLDRRLASAQAALQALDLPIQKDFAPLVVSKPFGSKIRLTRDTDSLEILMPRKGFSAEVGSLIPFAIAWNTGISLWTIAAVFSTPTGLNLFFALFSLPFWGAGMSMIWRILSTLFGRVRISLDRQQISRTYELFGFKFNRPRPAPTHNISKLEIEYIGEAKARIIIWAGTLRYELSGYSNVTELELDWLADELRNWLGIPITRK